jgi:hypothetical protein
MVSAKHFKQMKQTAELAETLVLLAKHVALVFVQIQKQVHLIVDLAEMHVQLAKLAKKEFVICLH